MGKIFIRLYQILFAKKKFRKIHEATLRLSLRGLGILNYQTDKVSGEKHLLEKILVKKINSASPIMFDVGANVGEYSKSLSKYFPNASIYAFEPHPIIFKKLSENISPQLNINLFNLALGSKEAQIELFDRSEDDGSEHASVYENVINEIHHVSAISHSVYVNTINNFAEKENIEVIDFLKIDTEGHEYEVLKGASTLLSTKKIKIIQIEFNEMNVISRVFFRDIQDILKNYDLYRLLPSGLLSLNTAKKIETEVFGYQNLFATLKTDETK